jgi:hypothetical protein
MSPKFAAQSGERAAKKPDFNALYRMDEIAAVRRILQRTQVNQPQDRGRKGKTHQEHGHGILLPAVRRSLSIRHEY